MNITDVGHLSSDADTGEDKMLKGAKREHKTVLEIADYYTNSKNRINEISAKEWHLAKLMKFHKANFTTTH